AHPIYPYLLKDLTIDRPNAACASDITYIPRRRGFVYLVAIIDWATRRVLAHRVSISLTSDFCVEALDEAIAKYGAPEIFNTDQGSQFTSDDFTDVLKAHPIRISMDGKGRWIDNVFVEPLWKSVKYEHVYLHAYESVAEARQQLTSYFTFYNTQRPHSSLGGTTPDTAYFGKPATEQTRRMMLNRSPGTYLPPPPPQTMACSAFYGGHKFCQAATFRISTASERKHCAVPQTI